MAISEARGTAKVVQLRPAPQVEGLEVSEAQLTTAEFLELMNGPACNEVPHVRGELVKKLAGPAPELELL